MQNLLWIGNPSFAGELQSCGWKNAALIQPPQHQLFSWPDILAAAGFTPDVLIVADSDLPPYLVDPGQFPCLTVFYAASSPAPSWQAHFAQAFDACLVADRVNLEGFQGHCLSPERIWWLPPYAKNPVPENPPAAPEWDCLFIGENAESMPAAFVDEVASLVPVLQTRPGDFASLVRRARIILDHGAGNELDFRFFETLGSGACLVSPRMNNGMEQLFVDGEHFVGYAPGDAGDAAWKINYLLKYPDLVDHIRQTGQAEIREKHLARHRAEALTDHLCDLFMHGSGEIIQQRLRNAEKTRHYAAEAYLEAASGTDDESLKNLLYAAAHSLRLGE